MDRNNQQNKPAFRPGYITKLVLVCASVLFSFVIIETYFRIFDYYPYFSQSEINGTEHGNLSEYDPVLGWKGTPGDEERMTTNNNSVWLEHNSQGFRDIEHRSPSNKPAIVFLGDSFTWGFEVEFDEMFVNLLRDKLKNYEIINLSHRGYSTDQEFLTFNSFHYGGPIKLVALMFCENDVGSNNSDFDDKKYKPEFEIVNNELVLTGVPVPKVPEWENAGKVQAASPENPRKESIKKLLLNSYFLHDLYFMYKLHFSQNIFSIDYLRSKLHKIHKSDNDEASELLQEENGDPTLTSRILQELKKNVSMRGARLVIFFIPSKIEIKHLSTAPPYQQQIKGICKELDITCVDLAPYFKNTWRRTYFHEGMHWNKYGHRVAAEAIYDYLSSDPGLNLQSKKISRNSENSPHYMFH